MTVYCYICICHYPSSIMNKPLAGPLVPTVSIIRFLSVTLSINYKVLMQCFSLRPTCLVLATLKSPRFVECRLYAVLKYLLCDHLAHA